MEQVQCPAATDAAVIRLNSDGSLDAAFGDGGKVRFNISTWTCRVHRAGAGWQHLCRGVAGVQETTTGVGCAIRTRRE
jgi:hypothetical protein